MSTTAERPQLIFGTGLLGMRGFVDSASFEPALNALLEHHIDIVDTAPRYPPMNMGESERILGSLATASKELIVDTKVLTQKADGAGELTAQAIATSIEDSQKRLGINKFRTLYAHSYDTKTPLDETAAAFDHHLKLGAFERWGVCGFPPEKLVELLDVCSSKGYSKPAVYQGEYNVVTRGVEDRILPILRQHGLNYVAHRPLATGFLSGNFTRGDTEGTRFGDDFKLHGVFRQLYGDEKLHTAMKGLEQKLASHDISAVEASLRWLVYHSSLAAGDGVIFGCSSVQQIEGNAAAVAKGPLPADVSSFMDSLWSSFKDTDRAQVL